MYKTNIVNIVNIVNIAKPVVILVMFDGNIRCMIKGKTLIWAEIHLVDASSPVLDFLFPTLLCKLMDHFKLLHLPQPDCVTQGNMLPI